MTEFWIYSLLLSVAAALFIIVPMFRASHSAEQDDLDEVSERKRQNVLIFRERLAELEKDVQSEVIDNEQFERLKTELEQSLLSDVDGLDSAEPAVESSRSSSPKALALVMLGALFVSSYLLYFEWGAYDKQEQHLAMSFAPDELEAAQEAARSGDMDSLIDQLYSKLQSAPDNIEGWMLLARTAMNVEKYDLAVEGFSQVISSIEKAGENPAPVYGLLAQAHYFQARGQMTSDARSAIESALANDENETNAIGLLAIYAFDQDNYEEAVSYWQRLLEVSPDHPARASIEAGITRAKALGGLVDGAPENAKSEAASMGSESTNEAARTAELDSSAEAADVSGAAVRVRVSLSPDMASKVSPQDTLFIFARSLSGPPMPLAASKHVVAELPIEVVLTDANAMAPMAKLSNVSHTNIVARVSKSGQPIAQAGDLYGQVENVSVNDGTSVDVLIDTVQP